MYHIYIYANFYYNFNKPYQKFNKNTFMRNRGFKNPLY